ncbi:MAG: hypothetical protein HKN79_08985, partial [Flavobacteriales bacterium]|nr:hypothetical protein [Flavobacteriales bacterium]
MRSKRDICRSWFDRVWSQEDPQAIYDMFVPEGDVHGLRTQEPIIGPDGFA